MKVSTPRCLLLLVITVVAVGVFIWLAYNSMQQPPAFYQRAITLSAEELAAAGDKFEQTMIDLSNQIRFQVSWAAEMSAAEINGWMASDLPEKFPELLPTVVEQPRIAIDEDRIHIAFRIDSRRFQGFVDISGSVFCTNQSNQIALEISRIGSGIFSIPISYWAPKLETSLASQGIILTWTENQGNPVALIQLPVEMTHHDNKQYFIESIDLIPGRLRVFGRTQQGSPRTPEPRTSELDPPLPVSRN